MQRFNPQVSSTAILACAFLIATGCKKDTGTPSLTGLASKGPALKVNAYRLQPRSHIASIFSAGTVVAIDQVMLSPETGGKLVKLDIPEGRWVQKGQLIAKLNDAELQAQLQKLRIQEALASEKEDRKRRLRETNSIGKDEYEDAKYQLEVIRADMGILKSQIEQTEVRAPFPGVVGLREYSAGAYVQAGTPLVSLVDPKALAIEFYVPEQQGGLVRQGQRVRYLMDGVADTLDAVVYASEAMIDNQSRSLKVRARATNPGTRVKPGAYARVFYAPGDARSSIFIPTEALIPVLKGYKVYVYKGGKAEEVVVETGIRNERESEIRSGLHAGDTLIASGMMRLRPGISVNTDSVRVYE
ncbi:MAG: efflux RND transporter periplasmic adaptor subunit [Saprospiraceae bacterium]|nr:efflux RND transporter periplasmic adaptor subunit [Saprospiraceae bacterium]